jgi:mycothiol system anti-sigma-R factor
MELDISTCHQVVARLYEYLDRELTPEEAVAVNEHLSLCRECAELFRFEEELLTTIRDRCRRINVPRQFRQQIEAIVAQL